MKYGAMQSVEVNTMSVIFLWHWEWVS